VQRLLNQVPINNIISLTQFLGLLAVIPHLESIADQASNIRRNKEKAAETGLGFNQMIQHVGHTATVHMTDQHATVNAAEIAEAREQMQEHGCKHGSKRLEYGARKRLLEQPDLLAMTGLVVNFVSVRTIKGGSSSDDTALPYLMCAEVRVCAVVNTEKLLGDSAKSELVKDARAALGLPAEGVLSFKQKCDLSYVTLAAVNTDKLLEDSTKRELVKDAQAALGLPAEGTLSFDQKRDLSYVTLAVVNAEKLLADLQLVKDARVVIGLPAEGTLSFDQKCDLSYVTLAVVNAEKLLANHAKLQLVKDARAVIGLPAEGGLSFDQKRDLSYVTLAVVNSEKMLADPAKLQLVKDARAVIGLPAEGALSFTQKRDLSYVKIAVVNSEKLLADPAKLQLVKDARAAIGLPAEGALSFKQKRDLSYWISTSVSVPTRIRNVTQQIGGGRVLEQQVLRPTHTNMQFAMSLMKLIANKPIKMLVNWKGSRKTLTGKLFVDIATSFLTNHVAIDSNLSGGASAAPGKGDVASRAMVDGLCVMANITPVAVHDICDAVLVTGHTYRVYTEMNSIVGQAVDKQLPPLPVFADRHSLDAATFDAIQTRLLTHFNVSVARFGPGGSSIEKKAWASSIKPQYRNARRLMFA
jgi:hypothetical protein